MSHQLHNPSLCPKRLNLPIYQYDLPKRGYVIAWGTCLTSCPTSWHPTANTTGFFDVANNRARILSNLLFCSVSLIAFSRQNSSLRWGGVHERCPNSSSEEYSSKVLCQMKFKPGIITLVCQNLLGVLLGGNQDLLRSLGPSISFRKELSWIGEVLQRPWLASSPLVHSWQDSTL